MNEWYQISNIDQVDSPALVIFPERVAKNIETLVNSIDDISRLRPHIKTHKSDHVTQMMLDHGISKFKCATIAEAEMLATSGARDILLAYQPVGPKAERFLNLVLKFPDVAFACLIDNFSTAQEVSSFFQSAGHQAKVYIDLNVGMNRTGISPEPAFDLISTMTRLPGISLHGLHAYDGHIRDENFSARKKKSDEAFGKVEELKRRVEKELSLNLVIVAGGTPTYSVHSQRKEIECSPGTFIYWDKGYERILSEQHYLHAAVVISRIISKPAPGIICADLGHKSIASENPIQQRVYFINGGDLQPIGHSEEHLVLQTSNDTNYKVGDVLYGIPYHVCPTIALYERSAVAKDGLINEWWMTTSRNRKITV
jgi:D-threonine aldolase